VPLIVNTNQDYDEDTSGILSSPVINFGELLFPNFNTIVPLMFEFLPQLDANLIGLLTRTIYFAFKTQIFDR
jgi:hypothetical protein